jgi:hypothetical protein
VQLRQVVERHFLRLQVGILIVDGLDAEQREIAFVFFGRADLTGDRGPRLQPETTDLAGRNIDVVRAGKVVVFRTAEKAETVGQDFQSSLAVHQAVHLHAFFQDLEDQVLALHAGDFGEILLPCLLDQLRHAHFLQFGDVDLALLDFFVAIVGVVAASGFFGQFFGQRQRFFVFRIVGRRFGSSVVVLVGFALVFVALTATVFAKPRALVVGHGQKTPEGVKAFATEARTAGMCNGSRWGLERNSTDWRRPGCRGFPFRLPAVGQTVFADQVGSLVD